MLDTVPINYYLSVDIIMICINTKYMKRETNPLLIGIHVLITGVGRGGEGRGKGGGDIFIVVHLYLYPCAIITTEMGWLRDHERNV